MSELLRPMFDDASPSVLVTTAAHTADFNSETFSISQYDRFGIMLNVSAFSGTNETMDITVEESIDGGTTWYASYPGAVNTDTQAALTQIVATGAVHEMWDRQLPVWKPGQTMEGGATPPEPKVRFKFNLGGTDTPSITFNSCLFIGLQYRG